MLLKCIVTILPVIFLIVLFVGGNLMRRQNINMDGIPPINSTFFYISKYAIVIIWAAMALQVWGIHFYFANGSQVLKTISIILWIAGFSLLFSGRFKMGRSFRIGSPEENTSLKQNGLFRFSRNPMYLGVFSTLIAAVIYTLNPVILLIAIFIIFTHHKIVLAEEDYLRNSFGEQYLAYCRRVRRYI